MKRVIYATGNPGKIEEVRRHLATRGIKVETMQDFGRFDIDVEETGKTLGENALLKVNAYTRDLSRLTSLRGEKLIVFSDDSGLEIGALGGEPGIHVRRWKDGKTRMTDEEIIAYALLRMRGLSGEQRRAELKTVIAASVVHEDGIVSQPHVFTGKLRGSILETPNEYRAPGFPFESLFFVEEWGKTLGEVHRLPEEQKASFLTHRERAVEAALPFFQQQLS